MDWAQGRPSTVRGLAVFTFLPSPPAFGEGKGTAGEVDQQGQEFHELHPGNMRTGFQELPTAEPGGPAGGALPGRGSSVPFPHFTPTSLHLDPLQ